MKSTIKGALVAFSVSALGAFALMSTSPASAAAQTVWGRTCFASGGGTICPFQGGSAAFPTAVIYYDFVSTGTNKFIVSEFYRLSYSGTLDSSSTNGRYDAGFHETSNNVTGMRNTSVWDYVYAAVVGEAGSGMNNPANIYGMALVTN